MSDEDDYVHSPTDRKRRCLSTKLCSCWVIVLMVFGNVAMFGLGMIAGKNLPDIQHGYLGMIVLSYPFTAASYPLTIHSPCRQHQDVDGSKRFVR